MLITEHGKECMASGIRRLLTISVVFIVMVCLLVLVAMNVWYGIVAALLLWDYCNISPTGSTCWAWEKIMPVERQVGTIKSQGGKWIWEI